jgi:hypothetical protein
VEALVVRVESDKESRFPGSDFEGTVAFSYTGLQLYLRGRL